MGPRWKSSVGAGGWLTSHECGWAARMSASSVSHRVLGVVLGGPGSAFRAALCRGTAGCSSCRFCRHNHRVLRSNKRSISSWRGTLPTSCGQWGSYIRTIVS